MTKTLDIDLDFTAERVKRIRVLLGETQEQFGSRLKVDGNIVSRWERGDTVPTHARILKALLEAEHEALNGDA